MSGGGGDVVGSFGFGGCHHAWTQSLPFSDGATKSSSSSSSSAEASLEGEKAKGVEGGPWIEVGSEEELDKEDRGDGGGGGDSDEREVVDTSNFTKATKIRMPDLGEAGEDDGKVVKWYKKEGGLIKRGDILCDIQTELFTFAMQSEDEYDTIMGTVLVPEGGEAVKPGEVLCITLHEDTKKNGGDNDKEEKNVEVKKNGGDGKEEEENVEAKKKTSESE